MPTPLNSVQFSQLVDMYNPAAVFEEVKSIFVSSYPVNEFEDVRKAYKDFMALYDGEYPGYCACNTHYHDKMHITDSLLAMARLIDGYNVVRKKMPVQLVKLGFMAAIFHDAGYIQSVHDMKGTGAKYTLTHVERSINFVKNYFAKHSYGRNNARIAANMILCTDMILPIEQIKFRSAIGKTAGLMLASADLLGQMASRCYLERLLFLYREFREGHVKGYSSELGLLRKTLDFSKFIQQRLKVTLKNTAQYVHLHFKKKYHIDKNFYREAMEKQLGYLQNTVLKNQKEYRKHLRRAR
ncbi:MAG: hypothetical protein KKH28_04455 [Elusimicrobia bacterium]|nr:hypothetical protein [Elusimicrobiota bacterium]